MSDGGTKETYFKKLFNEEFPPSSLKSLECPRLERHILNLIRSTKEDGSKREPVSVSAEGVVSSDTVSLVTAPALSSAVHSTLNPFGDYTKMPTTTTCKHSLSGHEIDSPHAAACPHCKLPHDQCVEKLFGSQMAYYFKKAAMELGAIYYPRGDTNDSYSDKEDHEVILKDFRRLLTQLKFAVAIMNGTSLPAYPATAKNPFITRGSGCKDMSLPDCVLGGSYRNFMNWLDDQKAVHEWGYEFYGFEDEEELPDVPMYVVNFYREDIER